MFRFRLEEKSRVQIAQIHEDNEHLHKTEHDENYFAHIVMIVLFDVVLILFFSSNTALKTIANKSLMYS